MIGLSLASGKFKSSKLEGKYSLGGQKSGKLAQFKAKVTGKDPGSQPYKHEYPLRQTGLEVGNYRQTGSVRYLGTSETTRL